MKLLRDFMEPLWLYSSGRQPPGRGPVPVREEFVTGPYRFPG